MQRGILIPLYVCFLFIAGLLWVMPGDSARGPRVVVYTSVDDIYAIPILRRFEAVTGIRVDAVFDTEATKAVSLANRIVAERGRPRCDVFWNGEILRTLMLEEAGVLEPYRSPSAVDIPREWVDPQGHWTGFAARARVIVHRTDGGGRIPRTLEDLADPAWRGRVGFPRPFAGTGATHVAALCQVLGQARALDLLRRWKENGLRLLPGNSMVRDAIVRGELSVGVVDTDDVWVGKANGKPIDMVYPDAEGIGTLVIPNTVALIRGAPHPTEARRLIDWLLSVETEAELARSRSRQIPVRDLPVPDGVLPLARIRTMKVVWDDLPRTLREVGLDLEALFRD